MQTSGRGGRGSEARNPHASARRVDKYAANKRKRKRENKVGPEMQQKRFQMDADPHLRSLYCMLPGFTSLASYSCFLFFCFSPLRNRRKLMPPLFFARFLSRLRGKKGAIFWREEELQIYSVYNYSELLSITLIFFLIIMKYVLLDNLCYDY